MSRFGYAMPSATTCSEICRKYLRVHLTSGIGPLRLAALLSELGDIDAVLNANRSQLTRVRGVSDVIADRMVRSRREINIDDEITLAARFGVRIRCIADDDYPRQLRLIDDPPTCLYIRGSLQPEDAVSMAVVGSRHCSRYGAEQAERFSALLAGVGFTVVSGLARGIDTAAHRGALSAGGRTIAVLGCGLAHLYPPESGPLADEIVGSGALVSELPMDVAPDSKNFPPRNRIITGLSLGTLVIEAARRSGALITARLAAEYNREVFAVPGRIDVRSAEGCNDLIKSGSAKLVANLEDIMNELGDVGVVLSNGPPVARQAGPTLFDDPAIDAHLDGYSPEISTADSPQEVRLKLTTQEELTLARLGREALSIESICEDCTIPPGQVAAALTGLQLKGLVKRVRGDQFERANR